MDTPNVPGKEERISITTFEEAESLINTLHHRTMANKVDITLLKAQVDYLSTPRYRFRRRRLQRAFLTFLAQETSE